MDPAIPQNVGIDVGKFKRDVCLLPARVSASFDNSDDGIAKLVARC